VPWQTLVAGEAAVEQTLVVGVVALAVYVGGLFTVVSVIYRVLFWRILASIDFSTSAYFLATFSYLPAGTLPLPSSHTVSSPQSGLVSVTRI